MSNLKKYSSALTYINNALKIDPGNKNTLLSKKYIKLGLAYKESNNLNYKASEKLLTENLIDFPNDTKALINLANLYITSNQINKAENIYSLIREDISNLLISLNGLSLVQYFKRKNKQALEISKKEIQKLIEINGNENWILVLRANLNVYKSNFKKSIINYTITY